MSAVAGAERFDAPLTLLRSVGQVVLQANAMTGACLLAALLVSDLRLACAALIGAVVANVLASVTGYDARATRDGVHGFNGVLAALASFVLIGDTGQAIAVAILAASAATWLLGPWSRWLRTHGFAVYSSPCLLATWLWLSVLDTGIPHSGPSATDPPALPSDAASFVLRATHGILAGLAQTEFTSGALAGALVLAGIAAASRRHALWAVAGAALASAIHLLIGAHPATFSLGLLGFNGALTALALAGSGARTALGGVIIAALLQYAAGLAGLPALSAPFVIATWSALGLKQLTQRANAQTEPGACSRAIIRERRRIDVSAGEHR